MTNKDTKPKQLRITYMVETRPKEGIPEKFNVEVSLTNDITEQAKQLFNHMEKIWAIGQVTHYDIYDSGIMAHTFDGSRALFARQGIQLVVNNKKSHIKN